MSPKILFPSTSSSRPIGFSWRSSTWFILFTVTLGMFADFFLYGLIVPVIPFLLEHRLNIPRPKVQLNASILLTIYSAAQSVCSLIVGIVCDKLKSKHLPFILGMACLAIATTLLTFIPTLAVIQLSRLLQGLSSAVVWTLGFTLCLDAVGPTKMGPVLGTVLSVSASGALISPPLGGALYQSTGLMGIYGVSIALLVIDTACRILVIERKVSARYHTVESTKEKSTSFVPQSTGSDPDPEILPIGSDASSKNIKSKKSSSRLSGKTCSITFNPYILPVPKSKLLTLAPILQCFRNPCLVVCFLSGFTQAMLVASLDSTVPTAALELFGFGSLKSGLLFLPVTILDVISGPLAGKLTEKLGTKVIAVSGYIILTIGHSLLRLCHAGGSDQIALYCVLLAICGMGIGITNAPALTEAAILLEKYEIANPGIFGKNGPYAQLYGLNCMVYSLGMTLGPMIAGSLKTAIGYGNMNSVIGGICLLTTFLTYEFLGERPKSLNPFKARISQRLKDPSCHEKNLDEEEPVTASPL